MDKNILKYFIDIGLLISFIATAFTGLIKVPGFLPYWGISRSSLPLSEINIIHDYGGIVLLLLIILHFALNWNWMSANTTKIFKKRLRMKHLMILFLLILVAFPLFNMFTNRSGVIKLKGIEIREYNGEKLSSVNDFHENSIKGPQYINIENYSLEVTGLVNNPKNYSYEQLLTRQKYSKVVTLYCVEGWNVKIFWEGILVKDILQGAGIKPGTNTVIFYAYDGYSTSLPLDYIINNDIIMAYKMNNVTLPPERGFPFQLVAEDKLGYKWIKWITKIELSNNTNYKGYWESAGYSNEADVK